MQALGGTALSPLQVIVRAVVRNIPMVASLKPEI
jgi:hypothetical protein